MVLSKELGFRMVVFETGCSKLYQWWDKPSNGAYVFVECRSLGSCFEYVDFSFVRREAQGS